MKSILTDENISRDERYMLFLFITINIEEGSLIKITLNSLMDYFKSKSKIRILNVLNSLAIKGYISVIKSKGKANIYKITRDYLIIGKNSSTTNNTSINEDSESDMKSLPDSSNKINTTSDIRNDTGIKYSTNSGVENDTTIALESESSIKSVPSSSDKNDTTGGSRNGTGIKSDTTRGIKNDTTTSEKSESGIKTATGSSIKSDTTMVNKELNINNNKLNYIYINNKLYKDILNQWNNQNINNEKIVNQKIIEAINKSIKLYDTAEILNAIDNYSKVYKSNHYYNYRWNIINFLSKPNGISRFLDNGDIWLEYKAKYYSEYDELKGLGIDIESYID